MIRLASSEAIVCTHLFASYKNVNNIVWLGAELSIALYEIQSTFMEVKQKNRLRNVAQIIKNR